MSPFDEAQAAMRCPFRRHEDTQVLDTRVSEEGDSIRRRRRCIKRFTTYERVELTMPAVIKKNGSRAEFDSTKLRASLIPALCKRPVSVETIKASGMSPNFGTPLPKWIKSASGLPNNQVGK